MTSLGNVGNAHSDSVDFVPPRKKTVTKNPKVPSHCPNAMPNIGSFSSAPPRGGEPNRSLINLHKAQVTDEGKLPSEVADPPSSSEPSKGGLFRELKDTVCTYPKWCAELTSQVLKSKTPFAAYLKISIQQSRGSRVSKAAAPTFFPIPVPHLGVYGRTPESSSVDSQHNRHLSRATHVIVSALNFWYLGGRHGDIELLRREPNEQHRVLFSRIKLLIRSEEFVLVPNLPKAGRRFPELMARMSELTDALILHGPMSNPYDKNPEISAVSKDDTLDESLQPYHALDPQKIKLFGKGSWDPTCFLHDKICMAFRDPNLIMHGRPCEAGPLIRDHPSAVAELARKWDELGLLTLHRDPVDHTSLVRIFGVAKDRNTHRQIGDRRGQNAKECKLEGPSSLLPSGVDFTELCIDASKQQLHLSITDRKDFYHQFGTTRSKTLLNTIGPAVDVNDVKGTSAYAEFLVSQSRKRYDRTLQGDRLDNSLGPSECFLEDGQIWCSFRSILQGDHGGVEIATDAHSALLASYGLLGHESRMTAARPLRSRCLAEGLVIDDYFAVSIADRSERKKVSLAEKCYETAQKAYGFHKLLGSPQKDIVGATSGKAIGAFINGDPSILEQGLATVSAPPEKKLAMSHITLLLCQQKFTTDSLHLCLLGGWVSILGYRRPCMSILEDAFHLVDSQSYDKNMPKILPLTRKVANELVLLAVLIPLMTSEISAPFSDRVFCSDASLTHGAFLEAAIDPQVAEVLWKVSRTKGSYTRLLSPLESILRHFDCLEEMDGPGKTAEVPRPLAFSFEFLEIFSGASKITKFLAEKGIVCGPPIDLSFSAELDVRFEHVLSSITHF